MPRVGEDENDFLVKSLCSVVPRSILETLTRVLAVFSLVSMELEGGTVKRELEMLLSRCIIIVDHCLEKLREEMK